MTPAATAYPSHAGPAAEEAASVLQKHGKSFHFAGRLLDPTTLHRCARLYRFCRFVDDLGDTAPPSAGVAATLRQVHADLGAGRSRDPRVADLLALADECRFDPAPARALVEGVLGDLGEVGLRDERELDRYAYRVAGTVGLLMCGVLGVKHERALRHAVDLGMAMQFTNIARDVSEDAALGRRYVPASFFDKLPSLSELATGRPEAQPAIRRAVLDLLDKADRHYRSGIAGLPYLPWRARLGILVAAKVYQAIGDRIRARGGEVWRGRAMVSPRRKTAIAALALVRFIMTGGLPRVRGEHSAPLHRHLDDLLQGPRSEQPQEAS